MMSAAADDLTGASQVGAELRAERLRLGWSLEDIASALRIRLPFLEAIEEGRVGDLPGAAYAVGFLRAYAKTLGMDPDQVAQRFRAEAQEVNRKTVLTFPAPVPDRGVPAGAVVLLGLVIAIGAYAVWYKFSGSQQVGIEAPMPERFNALAERNPPSNTSPQVASILPPVPTPAVAPTPAPVVTPPQPALPPPAVPSVAPTSSASTSAQAAPLILPPALSVPVPVPVPVSITPAVPAPTAAAPETGRVMLKFKADSYIQVREKGGRVLLNRVMKPGESWPVPDEANLVMTTGNAGGTEIVVDGITAASLGGSGAVRRDLPLDPEAIKLPPGTKLPPKPHGQ